MHRLLRCAAAGLILWGGIRAGEVIDAGKARVPTHGLDVPPLAKVNAFAFGGVGYVGATSKGELAFRKVLASPGAREAFLSCVQSGTPAARCYALEGLRLLDRKRFEEEAARLSSSKDPVQTAAGCLIQKLPLGEVVEAIRKGIYDQEAKTPLHGN